jgi:hypothetical protein
MEVEHVQSHKKKLKREREREREINHGNWKLEVNLYTNSQTELASSDLVCLTVYFSIFPRSAITFYQ